MTLWEIIIPEATTNLVSNPSLETNTTGWAATSGSTAIARSTAYQRYGAYSLEVFPAAGTTEGAYYGTVALAAGTTYAISVWVRGQLGIPYKLYVASTGGAIVGSNVATFTGTGEWVRITGSYAEASTASRRIYITKNSSANLLGYYIDGMQVEAKTGYYTTYCDGSLPGCSWAGAAHASTSTRSALHAAGGRVRDLGDYGVYATGMSDVGLPPMATSAIDYGTIDGALYQSTLAKARPFTLQANIAGSSLTNLHALRKAFMALLMPDRFPTHQPHVLRYTGNAKTVQIKAVYDTGLNISSFAGFSEQLAIRMIAHDPFFFSETSSGAALTGSTAIASVNQIIKRDSSETWTAAGIGSTGTIKMLKIGPDGMPYICGSFGAGVSIQKGDGTSYTSLGTVAGGTTIINCMAFGPDGSLYAGGSFTSIAGVACNYIAKYNGSAWSALGTGMNAQVTALAVGNDGTLYAKGDFTTAGGTAATYIAKYNGSAWSALGTGFGASSPNPDMIIGRDQCLYVTGTFGSVGGGAATRIAKWSPASGAWSALGSGLVGAGSGKMPLAAGDDGSIYVGGGTLTSAGGIAVNNVAKWNGYAWSALGSGLNSTVASLTVINGLLYAGGAFTGSGSATFPDRLATWNGATWLPVAIDVVAAGTVINVEPFNGALWACFSGATATTGEQPALATITNSGTASAYPVIVFTGPGRLYELRNRTTDQSIYFDLTLNTGESATLDLNPGNKTFVSSFRGNIIGAILPGSTVAGWHLAAGANSVAMFSASTVAAALSFAERYWSIDGGA